MTRHVAPEFVDGILEKARPDAAAAAPAGQLPDALTEQEMKVLELIVAGCSNKKIAAELVITVGTAKWHVHNIYEKLGVNGRSQAIARAYDLQLV